MRKGFKAGSLVLALASVFGCSTASRDGQENAEHQESIGYRTGTARGVAAGKEWINWGGDLDNSHFARAETKITPANVGRLKVKWKLSLANSVATIPSYADDVLYFSDVAPAPAGVIQIFRKTNGNINAVDAKTGKLIWSKPLLTFTGHKTRTMTKTTPAIWKDSIILGDAIDNVKFLNHAFLGAGRMPGASVFAIDRQTGNLKWKTLVDPHYASRITQSPTVYDGVVYVGISSQESQIPGVRAFVTRIGGRATDPIRYKCCQFRGALVALDAETGELLWRTDMIPPPPAGVKPHEWFSGAPIWGASPSVDVRRGVLYVATGNNYNSPEAFRKCLVDANGGPETRAFQDCVAEHDRSDNYFDSIVALDLKTGAIRWGYKSTLFDTWTVACGKDLTNIPPEDRRSCPSTYGHDYDFGQAPMILHDVVGADGVKRDLVVAGQKSGWFYALNADDGKLVWKTETGPGGELGGHELGSATDGKRIYAQTTNLNHYAHRLKGAYKNGAAETNGGFWTAIDASSGQIVWQTSDPSSKLPLKLPMSEGGVKHPVYGKDLGPGHFAAAFGPVTLSPGVLFAGSLSKYMYALDAQTGKILWEFQSDGSVASAPTVIDGTVYWGTGYGLGFDSKEFYAFSIDGQ